MAVRSAGLFVAPFEALLRRLEPAITLSQLTALDSIAHAGTLRPYRLGQQMMISRQLAWQTCKRLEALGLVTMAEPAEGQSGVAVSATEAGIAHLQGVAAIHEQLAEELSRMEQSIDVSPAKQALAALATAAAGLCQSDQAGNEGRGGTPHRAAQPA